MLARTVTRDGEVVAEIQMEPAMSLINSLPIDRRRTRGSVAAVFVVAVAVVVWGGYGRGWSWTGLTTNATLWAWLKLLALPLSLASLPLWLRSHRRMAATRRAPFVVVTVVFGAVVVLGYSLHWRWTGFAGNTLWDWFEVLLLPVVIATAQYWSAERVVEARHRYLLVVIGLAFVMFAVCAYLVPIGWSGFTGNTLWDWVRLLLIPLLMPLVLVPAVTNWVTAGIADQPEPEPARTVTYDIWLTPQDKVTAQLVTSGADESVPELIITDAHKVLVASAT
jgi:hypothetical protein